MSTSAANTPQGPTPSDEEVEVSLYAARKKIYPRAVTGLFTKWRWVFVWLTQIVFYGLPWLAWNDRQAVLFDLEARRFYIFGLVLYPQDFIYLTGILVVSALLLFLFTAIAGRLWCGYACPQTVYTEIYLWMEKLFEGDRSARMRLDQQPWILNKVARKGGKHLAWIVFGLWTGFTFAGYFTPIRDLGAAFLAWNLGPWQTFWIFFYGFATYGNAGFMREQVCKYMCPYARFQSAMFDKDTMIVTYDAKRGEPRGARKRSADPKALGLGDCIDCTLCVQVCPTGIDIRNGLQYECISCGACVDVCDQVMEKMGYPKGLVKYSTQNGMERGWSQAQMIRRVFRPRVLIYSSILLAIVAALGVSLWLRVPLKVDVIRDRGALARMVEMGRIENVYRIQFMNASEHERELAVTVEGLPGIEVTSERSVHLLPTEVRSVAVRVQVPPGLQAGSHPITFGFRTPDGTIDVREKTTFVVPR
ncbi:cytochrome c oxidase accessory protein CcoG [Tepidimonas fonticaldi]|uniref:Cytochrome c oxidase accessory protein CcoG n=1 Tax=Tepidimonas fonticaldi TaxID=1101373 RepID=A0A1A6DUF1_9BURK|nr:cytochrome c oxidase accessory protein CcoG [Tepidimonas fonticaldi]OBS30306.1 cytochrome c oxidase accessory protein CcoG [Tepidimonas fonticaldi]